MSAYTSRRNNTSGASSAPSSYAAIAASAVATEASAASGADATVAYPASDSRSDYEGRNLDGGFSFDQCKATKEALRRGDSVNARKFATEFLVKVATIGTNANVVNASARELSSTAIEFVNYLLANGMSDLVVQVVRDVYGGSRAKSINHSMFLLALCTSVPDSVSGSQMATAGIRKDGYAYIRDLRTGSHFLTWVSIHIGICKARGTKGTGKGFRNACQAWFLKNSPKKTQYQVVKYGNRSGFTMKDVLALTHIKATSKCRNAGKRSGSSKIHDFLAAGMQFVLACVVNGFDTALTELDEIAGRKLAVADADGAQATSIGREMADALECAAYESAVRVAKSDGSTVAQVIEMINVFGITHEMVSNSFMKDTSVLAALASRVIPSKDVIRATKVELLAPYLVDLANIVPFFDAFQAGEYFGADAGAGASGIDLNADIDLGDLLESAIDATLDADAADAPRSYADAAKVPARALPRALPSAASAMTERHITMPYNACVRFLNRLTVAGLFDRASYPLAPQMVRMLTTFLVDPIVLEKSRMHPLAIFTALATYQSGGGARGSLTWSPDQRIVSALEDAIRVAFQNCKPHGKTVAHLIDASGSMTWPESCSIPGVVAREIVTFMVGLSMHIEDVAAHPEKFYAGYFGSGSYYGYGARARAQPFVDITNQLTSASTFDDCKRLLSKVSGGCTNMQVGFDHYRKMLEDSLAKAQSSDTAFSHIQSALELPGFIEVFQMWTDNDINSGKKVPECLDDYHAVQRAACEAFPRYLDGTDVDPALLYHQHCAKLVIVCTIASAYVVGDPFDSRILCISGFDSSGPQLITDFIEDWDRRSGLAE
jgi:hypothetical protein